MPHTTAHSRWLQTFSRLISPVLCFFCPSPLCMTNAPLPRSTPVPRRKISIRSFFRFNNIQFSMLKCHNLPGVVQWGGVATSTCAAYEMVADNLSVELVSLARGRPRGATAVSSPYRHEQLHCKRRCSTKKHSREANALQRRNQGGWIEFFPAVYGPLKMIPLHRCQGSKGVMDDSVVTVCRVQVRVGFRAASDAATRPVQL